MATRPCSPTRFPVLYLWLMRRSTEAIPRITSVNNNGVLFEKHVLDIPSIHTIT